MPAGKPVPSFAEQIAAHKQPTPLEKLQKKLQSGKMFDLTPEVEAGLKALAQQPITLELPLPPRVLHPNARTKSYGYRVAKTKEARDTAAFIASRNRPPQPFQRATIQATFYVAKQHDGQNLNSWIKAAVDGLQGICITNDRDITLLPPEQVTGVPVGQRRVVLTITPII